MIMVILTIHLLLAAAYTVSVIGLTIAAALRKTMPIIHASVVGSFGGVVGSGVVLVFVSPKAMTQFCISTLTASTFGVVAWAIYKRRTAALQPKKSTLY